jgi:hypothetical protein
LCGDGRIIIASRIKYLDGRDNPATTQHIGREQRELVLAIVGQPADAGGDQDAVTYPIFSRD